MTFKTSKFSGSLPHPEVAPCSVITFSSLPQHLFISTINN